MSHFALAFWGWGEYDCDYDYDFVWDIFWVCGF